MLHEKSKTSLFTNLPLRYWLFNFFFVVVASWLTAMFILVWILVIGPGPLSQVPDAQTSIWHITTAHPQWVIAFGLLFLFSVLGLWSLFYTLFMKNHFWQPEEYIEQLSETLIHPESSSEERHLCQQRLHELVSQIEKAQRRFRPPRSSVKKRSQDTHIEARH